MRETASDCRAERRLSEAIPVYAVLTKASAA